MGLGQDNTPTGDNKPNKGNKKGNGDGADQQHAGKGEPPSLEGASMPDLGEVVGAGFYAIKNEDTGKVLAGGRAIDFEKAIVLDAPEITGSMLDVLGVKSAKDVARALDGDSGTSTSVGYTPKYGEGWDRLFGGKQSNN